MRPYRQSRRFHRRAWGPVLLLFPLLLLTFSLPSCQGASLYTATFFDVFDTYATVQVVSASQTEAQALVTDIHDLLLTLDGQFDIYSDRAGEANLKTVNDGAENGVPVAVSEDILELLSLGQAAYALSGGRVNICMGAVLSLWHDAREDGGYVPARDALENAAAHTAMESLVIDRQAGTVLLTDPAASLDVGAIAKGYAAGRVAGLCEAVMSDGRVSGVLLDLGGHVLALGTARDGDPWQVGIRDPRPTEGGGQGSQILTTRSVTDASVVTSGTDQRFYVYDGVTYHHLIDPATLAPGRLYQSVTVYVPAGVACTVSGGTFDSTALADAISTALFLLSPEEGQALLSMIPGADAVWVMADGEVIGM